MTEHVLHPGQFKDNYSRPKRYLNKAAKSLSTQGTPERLWEMADYHAIKGHRNEEIEYREAARLREERR